MGWERKRGKLRGVQPAAARRDRHQLHRLPRRPVGAAVGPVRHHARFRHAAADGGGAAVWSARSRIRSTGRGSMPRCGRVTEGYGVLQPRVGVNVVSANRTAFAKVFSGHVGVDPYTTAVSDVYQDLFHEGSYVGKGIYDVDAFDAALANRVPENALLSHDLFEGFYARAGLCTDIHLVDDYPSHYLAFAARQHRWVRGDWQIVRWLWRTVPDAGAPAGAEHAAGDRALEDPRQPAAQPAAAGAGGAARRGLDGPARVRAAVDRAGGAGPRLPGLRAGGALAVEPRARRAAARARRGRARQPRHQRAPVAAVGDVPGASELADGRCDRAHALAPARQRRRLLEWVSADQLGAAGSVARAGGPPDVGRAGARDRRSRLLVATIAPAQPAAGAPADRALAALSRRSRTRPAGRWSTTVSRSAPAERAALRKVARKTWRFFEDWSAPADHWLVPDNYQEDRDELVAHRTSPTNIGLQLLVDAGGARLRLPQLLRRRRSARADVRDAARSCRATAAISTTGTTRGRSRRWCRRTSRRSTAATWPAIC